MKTSKTDEFIVYFNAGRLKNVHLKVDTNPSFTRNLS